MTNEDKLRAFSVEEICERLGLHRTTVQKLLRQGRLKGFKIGRIWKVPALALDEFLRTEAGLEPEPEPVPEPVSEQAFESAPEPVPHLASPEDSSIGPDKGGAGGPVDSGDEFAFTDDFIEVSGDDPSVPASTASPAPQKNKPKQTGKGFSAAFSRRFSMDTPPPEEE